MQNFTMVGLCEPRRQPCDFSYFVCLPIEYVRKVCSNSEEIKMEVMKPGNSNKHQPCDFAYFVVFWGEFPAAKAACLFMQISDRRMPLTHSFICYSCVMLEEMGLFMSGAMLSSTMPHCSATKVLNYWPGAMVNCGPNTPHQEHIRGQSGKSESHFMFVWCPAHGCHWFCLVPHAVPCAAWLSESLAFLIKINITPFISFSFQWH